jgi:hypothetical protein
LPEIIFLKKVFYTWDFPGADGIFCYNPEQIPAGRGNAAKCRCRWHFLLYPGADSGKSRALKSGQFTSM